MNDTRRRRKTETTHGLRIEYLENRIVLSAAHDLIGLSAMRVDPDFFDIDGTGISVAVIDTGVGQHWSLPLSARLDLDCVTNQQTCVPNNTVIGNHGTHVAGIIGSRDPEIGVAPDVGLIGLQVFRPTTSGKPTVLMPNLAKALDWVITNHRAYRIRVVNMSLGFGGFHNSVAAGANALRPIFDKVKRLEAEGVTVVSAAGNDCGKYQVQHVGQSCGKAAEPGIFSTLNVGAVWETSETLGESILPWQIGLWGSFDATTAADRIAHFSQRPPNQLANAILAPGANIRSTIPGGGTKEESGTSMAAPMVAGAVALIQEAAWKFGGRYLAPLEVQSILTSTGDRVSDGDNEASSLFFDANQNQWPECYLGECGPFRYTNAVYARLNVHNAVREVKRRFEVIAPPQSGGAGSGDANATVFHAYIGPTLNGTPIEPLFGSIGYDGTNGLVGNRDVDLFRFQVAVAGTVTLETARYTPNPADFDTVLRLFDANGNQIAIDNDGGDEAFSRIAKWLTPGTYFVGVSGFQNVAYSPFVPLSGVPGATGNYTLTFGLWNGELNGLKPNAVEVRLEGGGRETIQQGIIGADYGLPNGPSDVDLFRIVIPDDGSVLVDIDTPWLSGYVDSYLRVFDEQGTQIAFSNNNLSFDSSGAWTEWTDVQYPGLVFEHPVDRSTFYGHTTDSFLIGNVARGEVYYIGVSNTFNWNYNLDDLSNRSASGSEGSYKLSFRFVSRDLDGVIGNSIPLGLPITNLVGSVGWDWDYGAAKWVVVGDRDVDMFHIRPALNSILEVDIDSYSNVAITDKVDSVVYVLDSAGHFLAGFDNEDDCDPAVHLPVFQNQDYYVVVVGAGNSSFDPFQSGTGSAGDMGEYRLHARLRPSSDHAFLANDVMSYPGVYSIGDRDVFLGFVGGDWTYARGNADIDLYRYVAPATQTIGVLTYPYSEYSSDTYLRAFDAAGNELAKNDNLDGNTVNSGVVLSVVAGQTYYFGVNGAGAGADQYDPKTGANASAGSVGDYLIEVFPYNNPPTLTDIPNPRPILEDSGFRAIELTGITAGGESQPLAVFAVSSNPRVIPDPTVTYTSPQSTAMLEYAPAADNSGVVNITVHVVDGGFDGDLNTHRDNNYTSREFQITVLPVNDPPTLNEIASPDPIPEDSSQQTILVTGITAGADEDQPLMISATSDNPNLIPNPTVSYQSPSATGELRFRPLADQSGTATISVAVIDGGLDKNLLTESDNAVTLRQVSVTVTPVNDPPTIDAIADSTVDEDSGVQTVPLLGISAGGGEHQPLRVTVSITNPALIPSPTIEYISPETSGLIQYTPAADLFGSSVITVTVTDGGLDGDLETESDNATLVRTFLVQVRPINDDPTIDPVNDPLPIDEDAGEQTVLVTGISAGGQESQPLRVSATSDNTQVIPNVIVDYTSDENGAVVRYQPAPDGSGVAQITVTVTDGGLDGDLNTEQDNGSTTTQFQVVVLPVNDAPTLDPVNDPPAIDEDTGPQELTLTGISPGGGETQALIVLADSSDPTIIPNPEITHVAGQSTARLTYQSLPDANGTVQITVSVSDAGLDGIVGNDDDLATVRTFMVRVNPVNDPPSQITLDGTQINENDAGARVGAVAVDDVDDIQHSYIVSDTRFEVLNGDLRLKVGESLNFEAEPTIPIDVTATDAGGLEIHRSFVVQVEDVNDRPMVANEIPDHNTWQYQAFAYSIPTNTFSDEDTNQSLTRSASLADGSALPAWMSFDPATNILSGRPLQNSAGDFDVKITATDDGAPQLSISDSFVVTVVGNPHPWQNPENHLDVNGRDGVTPLDVLLLINYLNANPGSVSLPGFDKGPPSFLDVNGDDAATPIDPLIVINFLNRRNGGEGEQVMPWPALSGVFPGDNTRRTVSLTARQLTDAPAPISDVWMSDELYENKQRTQWAVQMDRRFTSTMAPEVVDTVLEYLGESDAQDSEPQL